MDDFFKAIGALVIVIMFWAIYLGFLGMIVYTLYSLGAWILG